MKPNILGAAIFAIYPLYDEDMLRANIPLANEVNLVGKGAYGRVYELKLGNKQSPSPWDGLAVKWSSRKVQGNFDRSYNYGGG